MTKNKYTNLLLQTLGCFISAAGIYSFAVAAEVPVTGVAGICAILYRLFGIPMGLSNVLINIPIILYNIPPRTGNKLLPETVQALCRDVDVIVGAKDSSGDIENLKAYIRLTRELDKDVAILAGNDGAILTCLKEGGAGGIAGRANIWPATVAKIYDCFKAGDLEGAQAAQDAVAILQQTFKYGNPNTIIKTAVALQGHPVGKCRAPFNYVPEEGMEAIKKVLAENEAKGLH